MFWVWSTTGVQTPYVPGALERRRRVERARAPEAVEPTDALPRDLPGRAPSGPHADAIAVYQHGEREHERRRAVTAAQLMVAPVVTLGPDAALAEAWELVRTHGFRHVPIVAPDGALVGMLSDRDLLRDALERRNAGAVPATHVRQIMATRVLTARPEASIRQVARILFEERIGAMPIVDEGGTLVGIVTRSDVLRAVLTSGPLELWI